MGRRGGRGESGNYSHPSAPPRLQIRPMAPAKPSALLAAMVVLTTSNGCPRVVTLHSRSCQPLANLTHPEFRFRVRGVNVLGDRGREKRVRTRTSSNQLRLQARTQTWVSQNPLRSFGSILTQQVAELDRLLLQRGRSARKAGDGLDFGRGRHSLGGVLSQGGPDRGKNWSFFAGRLRGRGKVVGCRCDGREGEGKTMLWRLLGPGRGRRARRVAVAFALEGQPWVFGEGASRQSVPGE